MKPGIRRLLSLMALLTVVITTRLAAYEYVIVVSPGYRVYVESYDVHVSYDNRTDIYTVRHDSHYIYRVTDGSRQVEEFVDDTEEEYTTICPYEPGDHTLPERTLQSSDPVYRTVTVGDDSTVAPEHLAPADTLGADLPVVANSDDLVESTGTALVQYREEATALVEHQAEADEDEASTGVDQYTEVANEQPVGDPVLVASGMLTLSETDLSFAVGSVLLEMRRTHRTDLGISGSLGTAWSFSWDTRIIFGQSDAAADVAHRARQSADALATDDANTLAGLYRSRRALIRTLLDQATGALDTAQSTLSALESARANYRRRRYRSEVLSALDGKIADVTQIISEYQAARSRLVAALVRLADAYGDDSSGAMGELLRAARRQRLTAEKYAAAALVAEANAERNNRFVPGSSGMLASGIEGLASHARSSGNAAITLVWTDGFPYRYDVHPTGRLTVLSPVGRAPGSLELLADATLMLTDRNGARWHYGYYGELLSVTDRNGNRADLHYDGDDQLIMITDTGGREVTIDRDEECRVVALSGPVSPGISYAYDGSDRLVSVAPGSGSGVTYEYEKNRVSAIVKPDGSRRTYSYDTIRGRERVRAVTDENGNVEEFDFSSPGRAIHTNRVGVRTTYETDPDGRVVRIASDGGFEAFTYDRSGDLVGYRTRDGCEYTFFYDESHNLLQTTYPDGTRATWQYDLDGRVVLHRDRAGLSTRYEYDSRGNTVGIHYWDNTRETFSYFPPGLPWSGKVQNHVDRRGNTFRHRYENRGMTHTIEDDVGIVAVYTTDDLGRRTSAEDGLGNITRYTYEADGALSEIRGPEETLLRFEYGERRDLVLTEANGRRSLFAYDRCHNLTSVTNALGERLEFAYRGDGSLQRRVQLTPAGDLLTGTRYEHDSSGNVATSSNIVSGATITFEYDERGRPEAVVDAAGARFEYDYDCDGRLQTLSRFDEGRRISRSWRYDGRGALIEAVDELGNRTTWQIDYPGRTITRRDPAGHLWTTELDPAGKISRFLHPDGRVETLVRDVRGRLVEVRDAETTVARYEYDVADRCIGFTDSMGNTWGYRYDGRDRLIEITQPDGSRISRTYAEDGTVVSEVDPTGLVTRYEYDPVGRMIAEIGPAPSNLRTEYEWYRRGLVAAVIDPSGGRWEMSRDAHGRIHSVSDPAGGVTTMERDPNGRITAIVDPAGRRVSFVLDGDGRVVSIAKADSLVAEYTYNAAGNLVRLADGSGASHEFSYDAAGRLVAERNRSGGETRYRRDSVGRVVEMTAPGGGTTHYDYDGRGRVIGIQLPNGSTLRFAYDPEGRLATASDGDETITVSHTWAGLPAEIRGKQYHQLITYDSAGRHLRLEEQTTGRVTEWVHDEAGRVCAIEDSVFGRIDLERDANGRLTARSPEEGPATRMTYDAAGRMTSSALLHRQYPGRDSVLYGLSHVRDEAGRRLFDIDSDGRITGYRYDEQGRLAGASYPYPDPTPRHEPGPAAVTATPGPGDQPRILPDYLEITPQQMEELEIAYRLIHPLRKAPIAYLQRVRNESFVYDSAGNRLTLHTARGDIDYTRDSAGNLIGIGYPDRELSFTYDALSRLVGARSEEGTVTHRYDPLGRRTSRLAVFDAGEPVGTKWVYSGLAFEPFAMFELHSGVQPETNGERCILQREQAPAEGRTRISMPEVQASGDMSQVLTLEGQVLAVERGGRITWFALDPVGSVVAEARGSARAGGPTLAETRRYSAFGSLVSGAPSLSGYGFAGAPEDPLTGLSSFGFRDYAPGIGQFLSEDPVRHGTNWYSYANNDPVNATDPLGLAPRNLTTLQRAAYKHHVAGYAELAPEIPTYEQGTRAGQQWDCADLCVYIASGAVESSTGTADYHTNLTAGGEPLVSIPGIHSSDFADEDNVTFYYNADGTVDNSFESPNVEAGTIGVFSGHVITVSSDRQSPLDPIQTIQGHATRPADAPVIASQEVLDEYIGDFIGWAEIDVDPDAVPCPWYFSEAASGLKNW